MNETDNNHIITIAYKDLVFEIDVMIENDLIMMDTEIYDLFEIDNVETQMTNLFFSRLIKGYHKKNNIKYDNNIDNIN